MLTVMERMISLNSNHVEHIKELLSVNPQWGRARLSRELCRQWEQTKRAFNSHPAYPIVPHQTELISDGLAELIPLQIAVASQKTEDYKLFNCLLSQYHYLGYRGSVGESLKYLVRDSQSRPLACLLFGSAAWKTAPRDVFIGWTRRRREGNLPFMTNNMRFLILPGVRVPHRASHILSLDCPPHQR